MNQGCLTWTETLLAVYRCQAAPLGRLSVLSDNVDIWSTHHSSDLLSLGWDVRLSEQQVLCISHTCIVATDKSCFLVLPSIVGFFMSCPGLCWAISVLLPFSFTFLSFSKLLVHVVFYYICSRTQFLLLFWGPTWCRYTNASTVLLCSVWCNMRFDISCIWNKRGNWYEEPPVNLDFIFKLLILTVNCTIESRIRNS